MIAPRRVAAAVPVRRRQLKQTTPFVLVVGALVAAGCGDDQDGRSAQSSRARANEIGAVVESFARALADGRVDDVCALLTVSGQEAMDDGHGSCEKGALILHRNVGFRGRQLWRKLEVQGVDRSGERVVVPAENTTPRRAPIFEGGVTLRRVRGRWFVDV